MTEKGARPSPLTLRAIFVQGLRESPGIFFAPLIALVRWIRQPARNKGGGPDRSMDLMTAPGILILLLKEFLDPFVLLALALTALIFVGGLCIAQYEQRRRDGASKNSVANPDSVWNAVSDSPGEAAVMCLRSRLLIVLSSRLRGLPESPDKFAARHGIVRKTVDGIIEEKILALHLEDLIYVAASLGLQVRLQLD